MRWTATILAAVMTLGLAACGQKGPLTLAPPLPTAEQPKAPTKAVDRAFPDIPATSEQK